MNVSRQIQDNFSRHARHYDDYCVVQNEVAGTLLQSYRPTQPPPNILELGCGTGNFTRLLTERFTDARILALDPSVAMIQQARSKGWPERVRFEVGKLDDLAVPHYDLIAANAVLHWQENLNAALSHLAEMLGPGGTLLSSWFGPRTYEELGEVLGQWLQRPVQLAAQKFPTAQRIETLLAEHVLETSVEEQQFRHHYDDLWDLLKTIKYTGTRGRGLPGLQLTRRDIRELEIHYRRNIRDVSVTYQIFYVQARGI